MSDDWYPAPIITDVVGGSGGTTAHFDDMLRAATMADALADQVQAFKGAVIGMAQDDALSGARLLQPFGVAEVQAMLDGVAQGPLGLDGFAEVLSERAAQLRLVVGNYEQSDDEQASSFTSTWNWLNGIGGYWLLSTAGVAALEGTARLAVPSSLEDDFGFGDYGLFENWQGWLLDHPDLIQGRLNNLPSTFGHGPGTSWQDLVGMVASGLDDGHGVATIDKAATKQSQQIPPPADLNGIISNLVTRNTPATAGNDEIDIQQITQPDGSTAYIVNIPGTKSSWKPYIDGLFDPAVDPRFNPQSNDNTTNLITLAGETSQREEAIAQALADAGVTSTDPVMLVGHSQGGMVAAQMAADSESLGLNITNVVTAGSPIALAEIPPDVQVLSLENRNDAIPWLDGADNPDHPNQTTVLFESNRGNFENHNLDEAYQDTAAILSGNPDQYASVADFMDSAAPFLADPNGGTDAATLVFDIERER